MKTTNIFGHYYFGEVIYPCAFFAANLAKLAPYFGLKPPDIRLVWWQNNACSECIQVGTRSVPLIAQRRTDHKLTIVCNSAIIEPLVIGAMMYSGYVVTASLLWNYVAAAFRMYALLEGSIPAEEYLRREHYDAYGLGSVYKDIVECFLKGSEDGKKMNKEVDAVFIGTYITQLVVHWGMLKQGFDPDAFTSIIQNTRRSNIALPVLTK